VPANAAPRAKRELADLKFGHYTKREKIAKLSRAQRKKVAARAAELVAEEMSLRQLRKARKLTQAGAAKVLGVTQDSVSRLEKRSDLLLSTLRKMSHAVCCVVARLQTGQFASPTTQEAKTMNAMGGEVQIVPEFPDRRPVLLLDPSRSDHSKRSIRQRRRVEKQRQHKTHLSQTTRKDGPPAIPELNQVSSWEELPQQGVEIRKEVGHLVALSPGMCGCATAPICCVDYAL
jgi:DNA-binding XRE family transcriptional regulator